MKKLLLVTIAIILVSCAPERICTNTPSAISMITAIGNDQWAYYTTKTLLSEAITPRPFMDACGKFTVGDTVALIATKTNKVN